MKKLLRSKRLIPATDPLCVNKIKEEAFCFLLSAYFSNPEPTSAS